VRLNVLPVDEMPIVRSAHARKRSQRDMSSIEDEVLVDLVRDGQEIVASADIRHHLELVPRKHLARRIQGVLTRIARLSRGNRGLEVLRVKAKGVASQSHDARPKRPAMAMQAG
jgi:hypothetical protein